MKTTHNLDFMSALWNNPFNDGNWQCFKIGTCNGQWRSTENSYQILSIVNEEPGNGHLNDVFEWFEASCVRDGYRLEILEVWNDGFAKHLISKRGFTKTTGNNLVKLFK